MSKKPEANNAMPPKSKIQIVRITELESQLKESLSHAEQEINDMTKDRDSQAHCHQENKNWAESLKLQVAGLESEFIGFTGFSFMTRF